MKLKAVHTNLGTNEKGWVKGSIHFENENGEIIPWKEAYTFKNFSLRGKIRYILFTPTYIKYVVTIKFGVFCKWLKSVRHSNTPN